MDVADKAPVMAAMSTALALLWINRKSSVDSRSFPAINRYTKSTVNMVSLLTM